MQRLKFIVFAFLFCYLIAAIKLVAIGLSDHDAHADLIVVPGNTVDSTGMPSQRLKARLDAALRLFKAKLAPTIFVSGGTGNEGIDESQAMMNYLISRGVPASAVIRDKQGVSTRATAINLARYMGAHKLKSALVATQYFHIARTRLALEQQGVKVVGSSHARYMELRDLYSIIREVIAYAAYCFKLDLSQ